MDSESKKTAVSKNSLNRLRNAFSHFTLLLTIGFGAVTTLTLIEQPSRMLQPTFATTTVRGPASVAGETLTTNKAFMATLDLNCDDKEELKTVSEHVRLKSKDCGANLEQDSTIVKNVSNGFSATVFHQGNSNFTTDYVALIQGENKIVIENVSKDGSSKIREITIIRE